MKTLLFILTGFLVTFTTSAYAGTCEGRCMNIGGNPSYDSFCANVSQSGGGKDACNQYDSLGCAWIKPPSPTEGTCVNGSGNPQFDAICISAGQQGGKTGCANYSGLGCVWSTSPVHCN